MSQTALETGFAFWRREAEAMEEGWGDQVPYTALIPLVGAYTVLKTDSQLLTSYTWRRTILKSPNAMAGLCHCLARHADDLIDDFEIPILSPDEKERPSLQAIRASQSVMDGLPEGETTIPWNEEVLARSLGFMVHDDAARLGPLRLLDQGWHAMQNHFPETAQYLQVSA